MSWVAYALLSALFAGMTAVLAKIGIDNVTSNLATLIRTLVIAVFAAVIVSAKGEAHSWSTLSTRNWTFLLLSGVATGASWLCYFAALKNGPVSQVAPIDKLSFVVAMILGMIFLHEKVTLWTWIGAVLILAGAMLTLPGVQAGIQRMFTR